MPWKRLAASALSALCAGCATLTPVAEHPVAEHRATAEEGQAFAERACAGCHAIGRTGDSRYPTAPAFRDLARQRTDAALAEQLAAISRHGHIEMPPIYMTPDEQAALVAYMRSLTGRQT